MFAGEPAAGAIIEQPHSTTITQYADSGHHSSSADPKFSSLVTEPPEVITDKDLYQKGARARRMIRGMLGQDEKLDKSKWHFHNLKNSTKGNRLQNSKFS
jgi:hypothetical protein